MRIQRFSLSNPRLKAYILIEYFFSNHLTIQNNHDSCPSILSLINFKTSGFALCLDSLGPKLAIPSILKYLAKPLNALAFLLILSWVLFLLLSLISLIFLTRSTSSRLDTLIFGLLFDFLPVCFSIPVSPRFPWFRFLSIHLLKLEAWQGSFSSWGCYAAHIFLVLGV